MEMQKIVSNPKVMMGKPVVSGTRITVEHVLEELSHGRSIDQLLEAYPTLTKDGILASLDYAVKVLKSDIIYPAKAG
jgi:uncharacterized protein (DUF433 family)